MEFRRVLFRSVAFAQAQIEREADDRAVRIIGCEDVAIDRIDRGCGIDEGRAQAHLLRRAIGPAGRIDDVIERASKRLEIIVEAALARAVDEQRAIILGEIGRASCGERVSVRVDLGGRRIIKKKKAKYISISVNIAKQKKEQ